MNIIKTLAILVLFLTGFRIFSKLHSASLLDWTIKGIKIKGNLLNLQLNLNTEIINNTPSNIEFNYFKGDIYLNDNIIGQINFIDTVEIHPGLTQVIIPIFLKPLHTIIEQIPQLTSNESSFYLDGIISFEGIETDIQENFKLI